MANGHGGARIGAGQKKKALSDKLVEGNPGKRKLTVMEFTDTADLQGETMPPPRDYLAARQKNGKELLAVEVYERTWTWLHERGGAHLICFHEPELFQAGQQPVVPNLSGRPGELLHRVQRSHPARRYDGAPAFCPARRLKHNFIQEVVYEYHTAPLGGGSPIQEQSAKE